jgi:hypothetical protein
MKYDTLALSQRLMVHIKTAEGDVKVSPINAINKHQGLIKEHTHT